MNVSLLLDAVDGDVVGIVKFSVTVVKKSFVIAGVVSVDLDSELDAAKCCIVFVVVMIVSGVPVVVEVTSAFADGKAGD